MKIKLKKEVHAVYKTIGIKGLGYSVGSNIITNKDIYEMSGIPEDVIEFSTGGKERRWAKEDENFSSLAIKAGKEALKDAFVSEKDIKLLVVATTTDNNNIPASGCLIQHELGIEDAVVLNLNGACASQIYALSTAIHVMNGKKINNALVITGDVLSRSLEKKENIILGMMGDGASAAVLGRLKDGNMGFLSEYFNSEGKYFYSSGCFKSDEEEGKKYFNVVKDDMGKILFEVINWFKKSFENCLLDANLQKENIDFFSPHPANIAQMKNQLQSIGIDFSKTHLVTDKFGHCGGGTQFIVLKEALKNRRIKHGDNVFMFANGSGFQYGGMVLRWNDKDKFI